MRASTATQDLQGAALLVYACPVARLRHFTSMPLGLFLDPPPSAHLLAFFE